jgi:hypothetical protein
MQYRIVTLLGCVTKLQRALFAVRDVRAEDAYQGDYWDISSFFGELLPRIQEEFSFILFHKV